MPTPTIPAGNLFMNATLFTGNNSTNVITNGVAGQSFQPGMLWIKGRSQSSNHVVQDAVRGANNYVLPNLTSAGGSDGSVTSFNSNGFSLITDAGVSFNANGTTYVGWNWKAGSSTVTNNDGNRTSQVSANTTSGFSVVTFTFTTSATNTIGHGLGVAPQFILMRDTTTSGYNWDVYHVSLGNTQRLILNSTAGASGTSFWAAQPTSTVFSITTGTYSNNDNVVAYCWAPIAGYSAFGSYTGNGSADGPFVYLGFRPRYVLIKCSSNGGLSWEIYDTSRNPYNAVNTVLLAENSSGEFTGGDIDYLSNGFKFRTTRGSLNTSGYTYIYAAFAENPFKYSNAR
jgi:hypothetical protein